MADRLTIIGLSGSLRRDSYNTAILNTIKELLPESVDFHSYTLHKIPLYNEDCDGDESPVSIVNLRQAVRDADALIIGSPEYNHGVSGVLKNALDWLSRPHGKSNLNGKPTLTFTASPAFTGGVRAHQQLNETLQAVQAQQIVYPQIVIGSVGEKVTAGRLADDAATAFLMRGVNKLVSEARAIST